jgi:hypothetical protein
VIIELCTYLDYSLTPDFFFCELITNSFFLGRETRGEVAVYNDFVPTAFGSKREGLL